MITWIFWELSLASKENPLACPIVVSREAHKFILIALTYPCSDDDMNNNAGLLALCGNNQQESIVLQMHDLWPEVVKEAKTQNPL